MIKFTNGQRDELMWETKKILEGRIPEGEAADENAAHAIAEIYTGSDENATHQQGMILAERVINEVKAFDLEKKAVLENEDAWLSGTLENLSSGMDMTERCNFYAGIVRIAMAIQTAADGFEEEAEQVTETASQGVFTDEEVSADLEAELKEEAKEALKGSGLMIAALSAAGQIEVLEELEDGDEAAQLLLYYADREVEFRAAASMLAYTKIKNGELKNPPGDLTLSQTTALVCAAIEQARVSEAVGKGEMAKETAAKILAFCGMFVVGVFLFKLAIAGIGAITSVFGLILSVAGCIAFVTLLLHVFAGAYDIVKEGCEKVTGFVCSAVSCIMHGAKAIFAYIKNQFAAKVAEWAGKKLEAVQERAENVKAKVKEKMAVVLT